MKMDKSNWKTLSKKAFDFSVNGEMAPFFLVEKKEDFFRIRVGTLNLGFLGSYSIKDMILRFGIRKVGVVGFSEKNKAYKVRCPYCLEIQGLIKETQKCKKCNKTFYLFCD
jgi:hypothetical protein